jgi:hypothetical protein
MWVAALVAAAAPLAQAERWQHACIRRAQAMVRAQMCTMTDLFTAEDAFEQAIHQRKLSLARELHLSEISHEIGIAQREAVRDEWAQHSLFLQSLMMTASLVFSCVTATMCEAAFPHLASVHMGDALSLVYAVACGLGVGGSLLTLWLSLKSQSRMAQFDFHAPTAVYSCGRSHFEFSEFRACHMSGLQRGCIVCFLVSVVATVAAGCLTLVEAAQSNDRSATALTVVPCVALLATVLCAPTAYSAATDG